MTLWVKWCFGHCLSISILRWGWRWLPGPAMVGRLLCWVVCSHRFILLYRSQTFCLHQSQRFYVSPYARSENNIEVFLGLSVCTSACQLSCWAKSSLMFFFQKCAQLFPHLPGSSRPRARKGAGAASKPANLRCIQAVSGWRWRWQPQQPQLPWHWRHSPGFFIFRGKKCLGQTPSFAEI